MRDMMRWGVIINLARTGVQIKHILSMQNNWEKKNCWWLPITIQLYINWCIETYRHFVSYTKYKIGVPFVEQYKNRVPATSWVQNKNKRVIDEMTRVVQSGETAADVGDVTPLTTNHGTLSPPVNLD